VRDLDRFTPTRVGTTESISSSPLITAVHPHACGDDVGELLALEIPPGSPPRVWGRLIMRAPCRKGRRFTPTRVGTTFAFPISAALDSVHPHACGDDGRDGVRITG